MNIGQDPNIQCIIIVMAAMWADCALRCGDVLNRPPLTDTASRTRVKLHSTLTLMVVAHWTL